MNYDNDFNNINPHGTPLIIRLLLSIIGGIGFVVALLYSFGFVGPVQLLSMSVKGLQNYFLWQPFTCWLVQKTSPGITIYFILNLLIDLYLLWALGSAIIARIGQKKFLRFGGAAIIIANIVAAGIISLTKTSLMFAGPEPAIYALLVLWMMFNPEAEMLLLLTFPIKVKWLVLCFLAIIAAIDIVQQEWVYLASYSSAMLMAYIYSAWSHQLHSPFVITKKLDTILNKTGSRWHQYRQNKRIIKDDAFCKAKIYDFKTGKAVLDDEQFMDAMLSKISQYGEKSLSLKEKLRMQKISRKKKQTMAK